MNRQFNTILTEAERLSLKAQQETLTKEMDKINPPHYKSHPSGVECIRITEHMNFCLGNAIKYIWRAGIKENTSTIEDLQKAVWYINREIARIQANLPLQEKPLDEKENF